MHLDILRRRLLEPEPSAPALQPHAAFEPINVLRVRPQELALGVEAADKVVGPSRLGLEARRGEFGDKRVEQRGRLGRVEQSRGEQVLARDELVGVSVLDEGIQAVVGAKVLRVNKVLKTRLEKAGQTGDSGCFAKSDVMTPNPRLGKERG